MAEFTRLSARERAILRRLERYAAQRTRFVLLRHAARATVRVADAMMQGLTPITPANAAVLADLSRRKADAYARLQHPDGAVRFADVMVQLCLRRLQPRESS